MGSMDRNTVIGFVLLAVLLFFYLFLSTKSSQELQSQQKHAQDSIAIIKRVQESLKKSKDTTAVSGTDSLGHTATLTEQFLSVENEVLKINFSNKGGQPHKVELKKYTSFNGKPVTLSATEFDKLSYSINTGQGQAAQTGESFFNPGILTKNADSSQTITFQLAVSGGVVVHQFIIKPNNYLLDWNVQMNGADKLLTQGAFNLVWQSEPVQHEKDVFDERQHTNICFYEDNSFDYIMSKTSKHFEKPVQWISVAQKFFNITLIAKNPFTSGDVSWVKDNADTSSGIARTTAALQTKLPLGATTSVPMQLYYGPNEYDILKQQAPDMDKIVNLGRDFYAFVRPINKS
mgnify:CR=1 FL=1